ncbi:hypothetical protein CFC21_059613 [Triticum aestivum]|uniref:Uncharacterized protein n=3 Tax=Triticum TaxID=4564 RepID=A0A9R0TCA3_TRITD|nr:hypothetical protein CFC21_059613 [Triticum aestivum]VAI11228.1 unnamed protein product [Triticum turgidum subsp. durum]
MLLTSFRDTCFVEIVPPYQAPRREHWPSFWFEVHYNSLYDAPDLPSKYRPRKKLVLDSHVASGLNFITWPCRYCWPATSWRADIYL